MPWAAATGARQGLARWQLRRRRASRLRGQQVLRAISRTSRPVLLHLLDRQRRLRPRLRRRRRVHLAPGDAARVREH
eukprot:12602463-Alexandrium_andersonii.AAC.1